ncbi:pyridoxal phosphate-dependent aminotransferase [Polymorphum gilvum]|uniref:aspartate transaminase n=1 Tax=Polymorphum gilvum (strain LMG 25793 / CGMCC 1.9160 / SL003B-26A1) TaxID=991905 RepID=F2IXL9_POLGS|nr:pyridoxal phosphate-dependent aminotransferase [Polymorphum gilvum]ADZ71642.1 Aminotransferase, classes I and II superfamily [Polymorphum gilvum SL003B-26A1]
MTTSLLAALRAPARLAPESGIVEVVNAARERADLVPLWVGEGDLPTPEFICAAAERSLRDGETFYTYQRGLPTLREALARYHERLYDRPFSPDRFFVTGSGMQAIQIALQMVAGDGDEVLVPSPAWPNFAAAAEVLGARAVPVEMAFSPDGWTLDLERLTAAITPRTRVLFVNSPCNPTGWVAGREILAGMLDVARRHGLWIVADEVYGRFYYGEGGRAPSFYDICEPDDRILFVNTFSKNWAMTGWRIGWLSAPAELGQVVENLIQYSTSGVAAFMQRAATVALDEGEAFVAEQIARAVRGRDLVCSALDALGQARYAPPAGAFYLFFALDGHPDSRRLALDLATGTGLGLAPGSAFGAGGGAFLRLCFARRVDHLEEGARRIAGWLAR